MQNDWQHTCWLFFRFTTYKLITPGYLACYQNETIADSNSCWPGLIYSVRNASAGLVKAALSAWKPTVSIAMTTAASPQSPKSHQGTVAL